MKQLQRIVLMLAVVVSLAGISPVRAQDSSALFRVGNFGTLPINILFSNFDRDYQNLPPNLLTSYEAIQPGEYLVQYAYTDTSVTETIDSDTITLEAGHEYTLIKAEYDRPALVIDHTTLRQERPLAEGENSLIIVTREAMGDGSGAATFKITDNAAPTPQDRLFFSYNYYMAGSFNQDGVNIERLDPATQQPLYQLNIPYLPNTHVIINGDAAPDSTIPFFINYATPLSVADWLAGINNMANPPFTFTHFLETATTGGFAAALAECPDYMWNVWTDAAFETLSGNEQAIVTRQPGMVMDASVLQPATTMPWAISPTQTRGGTPLTYETPVVESTETDPDSAVGNVMLTVSTIGSNVQNVIHIVDTVPAEFQIPRTYRISLRPRF